MHRFVPPRPPSLSAALIAGTIAAGLAIRKLPVGLPPAVVKHGGSILWASMVYWIVSTLRPRWRPRRSGIAAAVITTAIELSQLYHLPTLNAFRRTSLGALLLGRVFSVWDVATYAAAVGLAAMVDRIIRGQPTPGLVVNRRRLASDRGAVVHYGDLAKTVVAKSGRRRERTRKAADDPAQ
ncbi:MAG: DUF2809 domain-containing protein [Sphingomonas phyllosphaerae]